MTDSADAMLKLFMETGPIHDIEKFETALREQTREIELSYQMLSMYGVPRERARSVANGIVVLVTRMEKELAVLGGVINKAPLLPFKIAPHGPPVHKPKGPRK